jgi:16S rRNA (cytosine967-C5)-methyltransferase
MKESPRRLAVEILDRVEKEGFFAEPLLNSRLEARPLAGPDRAMLTMLVYGTLRMRGRLDWTIRNCYKGKFEKMETGILNILRTALYQVHFMDRVPDFAAVSEAVEVAKHLFPGRERLVNAILRKSLKDRGAIDYPDYGKDPALFISVFHSHPLWLVEKFISVFGLDGALSLCRANNEMPPVTLRVNTLKSDRGRVIAEFSSAGFAAEPTQFSPDGVNIDSGDIRDLPAYREGAVIFQDEASQLISVLAGPREGDAVLDLCAGSGVKTTHLGEIMKDRGRILAVDVNPGKLKALGRLAGRHGVDIIECRAADAASDLGRDHHKKFDLVLIDAPCSGTGTLRRNPEIKWRLTPAEVEKLSRLQREIIRTAPAYLKQNGAIFYSTCSVLPDENENVINDFCAEFPSFNPGRPRRVHGNLVDNSGCFRTSPWEHGMDGFFGVLLEKKHGPAARRPD